jgi:hypothetical protein
MRRRLNRFLPIVMLAVLVQILAPLGALRAVATIWSDPLQIAQICADDSSHDTAGQNGMQSGCCVACAVGTASVPPLTPPDPPYVAIQRTYQRIVWLHDAATPLTPRTTRIAQARAPPSQS